MDYPFTLPGHEQELLVLRTKAFGSAEILSQGVPLERLPGRQYRLTRADGSSCLLSLKPGGLSYIPKIAYGDQIITVAPPLPVYQQILIYIPLALLVIGGAIGGGCGGAAAAINMGIFRGTQPVAIKIVLSLVTTLGAVVLWIVLAGVLNLALRHS